MLINQIMPSIAEQHAELRRMMYHVHHITNENNIPYVITAGTLLGAVRHGDIIPWDDDIDLAMHQLDTYKLIELLPIFAQHGIYLSGAWNKAILNEEDLTNNIDGLFKLRSMQLSSTFIDIFPLISVSNTDAQFEAGKPKLAYAGKLFTKEWFYEDEFNNPKLYPLGYVKGAPLLVRGPFDAHRFLSMTYGDDYHKEKKNGFGHTFNVRMQYQPLRVTIFIILFSVLLLGIAAVCISNKI